MCFKGLEVDSVFMGTSGAPYLINLRYQLKCHMPQLRVCDGIYIIDPELYLLK